MIFAYFSDSTYYDVKEFMRKHFGYNTDNNSIDLIKFESNYAKIGTLLNKMSKNKRSDVRPFLYGILTMLQETNKPEIFENESLKKFVDKTINYLKEEYVFTNEKNTGHNLELNHALDKYPNYDLTNNFINIKDVEELFGVKLSLSKCVNYLIADIPEKFGYVFPEVHIYTKELRLFGVEVSDEYIKDNKYINLKLISIHN